MLKKDSLYQEEDMDDAENENECTKPETSSLAVSDLYKKYVISGSSSKGK